MARDLAEHRVILDRNRTRHGYNESRCLRAELVRSLEAALAPGAPPPVGVLKGLWLQVCQEYHDKPPPPMLRKGVVPGGVNRTEPV